VGAFRKNCLFLVVLLSLGTLLLLWLARIPFPWEDSTNSPTRVSGDPSKGCNGKPGTNSWAKSHCPFNRSWDRLCRSSGEPREAYGSAASLLALSGNPPRPKAGASSTHSMRFATFGCGIVAPGNIRA